MKTVGFQAGEILLPRCDLEKWSVVACDQFTSQPEYWEEVERIVGDAPFGVPADLSGGAALQGEF